MWREDAGSYADVSGTFNTTITKQGDSITYSGGGTAGALLWSIRNPSFSIVPTNVSLTEL